MNTHYRAAWRVLIAVAVLWLPGITPDAAACTCMDTGSVCGSFEGTPAVFIGVVSSVTEETIEVLRLGRKETVRVGLTAHFRIEERLKGVSSPTIDVATGGNDADCGYPFEAGERYLVYAYRSEDAALGSTASRTVIRQPASPSRNALRTSICGRTRLLANAGDDVALLRALLAGKPETRIFGTVDRILIPPGTYEFDMRFPGPIPLVSVRAQGPGGTLTTQTDAQGRYRFIAPRPGTYTVTVQPPVGYTPPFDPADVSASVTVTSRGCSAEHSFLLQLDGRISGRVYDSQRRPVADQVRVSVATRASAGKGFGRIESRSDYTKNGQYEIDGLPPGEYVLGISIVEPPTGNTPYATVYYPGATELESAAVITIGEGQRLTNIDIQVPSSIPSATLSGLVVRADGTPAADAKVELYDAAAPRQRLFGLEAKTDAAGRFSIKAYEGRNYLIRAYLAENYLAGTGLQSEVVRVDPRESTGDIRIVLEKPGIF